MTAMRPPPTFHETYTEREPPQMGSDRTFGFVFAALCMILTLAPLLNGHRPRLWLLLPFIGFLALGLFRPETLRPLNRLWFRLGMGLHAVISPVLMALIFYGLLTPMGLLFRRKNALKLTWEPDAPSYWIPRPEGGGPPPESMANPY